MICSVDEHEEAVKATARRLRRTEAAAREAREQHIAAVLAARRAGKRPTEVASWSAFTDAYLRQLARENGIPPTRKGRHG